MSEHFWVPEVDLDDGSSGRAIIDAGPACLDKARAELPVWDWTLSRWAAHARIDEYGTASLVQVSFGCLRIARPGSAPIDLSEPPHWSLTLSLKDSVERCVLWPVDAPVTLTNAVQHLLEHCNTEAAHLAMLWATFRTALKHGKIEGDQ